MPCAVQCQYRVGHCRKQRIQLQMATLAGEDIHHRNGFYATHPKQGVLEFFEHLMAEGRRINVDIGRHHLHGIQIQIAPTQNGQHFLGDTNAVDEADVDTHGALTVRGTEAGKYALC
ncbi:hypothetical protein AN901_203573 [Pseudomonas syringae pv. theae]|nr:hypothetical protein AN901_203573 [Pseudomonas syringae pv. theae]